MKLDSVHIRLTPTRRTLLQVLCATAAIAGPLAASAGTSMSDVPTVTVRYDDLNLASDAGTKALLRRLSAAADRVCAVGQSRELRRENYAEQCASEALSRAVVAVHNERLSTLYRAHGSTGAT
jgi:UrcA family protein